MSSPPAFRNQKLPLESFVSEERNQRSLVELFVCSLLQHINGLSNICMFVGFRSFGKILHWNAHGVLLALSKIVTSFGPWCVCSKSKDMREIWMSCCFSGRPKGYYVWAMSLLWSSQLCQNAGYVVWSDLAEQEVYKPRLNRRFLSFVTHLALYVVQDLNHHESWVCPILLLSKVSMQ
jgi:hypothetical protein